MMSVKSVSQLLDWSAPATLKDLRSRIEADGRGVTASKISDRTPCGEWYRSERPDGSPLRWYPSETEAVAAFWAELEPDLRRPGIVWWQSLPEVKRRMTSTSVAITGRWLVSATPVSIPLAPRFHD